MAKSNILHVIIIITFAFTASASYAVVSCDDMYQIALSIARSRDKGVPLETFRQGYASEPTLSQKDKRAMIVAAENIYVSNLSATALAAFAKDSCIRSRR